MLQTIWQDVRSAARSLRHSPGFAAAAVGTLTLGIGANTTIFSLAEAVLLRTLPVTAPGELFFVAHRDGDDVGTAANFPWYERVQRRTGAFAGVTTYTIRDFKVDTGDGLDQVVGQYAAGNYHAVVGVPIALGRGFSSEPDRPPASSPIAVISDAYWARRFGRSPDVIGRTLVIGGRPVTIVGVTAPGFEGLQPGRSIAVTLPLSLRLETDPEYVSASDSWYNMPIVVRLNTGGSAAAAESLLRADFREHMSQEGIGFGRGSDGQLQRVATLLPAARGVDRLRREYERPLQLFAGMVAVVLLIACVNVANLLLARGTARARELAIRLAIGASRRRVIRQLLVESILLALTAGLLGYLLAGWGARFITAVLRTGQNPTVIDAQHDASVLIFSIALATITGLTFGLVPAFRATKLDLTPALRAGAHGAVRGRFGGRKTLVAAQVALSVVLVFGAALLVRTLQNLHTVEGGFDRRDVVLFALDSLDTSFPRERMAPLCADVLDRVRARPGVSSASCSTMSPVDTMSQTIPISHPQPPPGPNAGDVYSNRITPQYFQTFGIAVVRGRLFTDRDAADSPRVAIVNETFARHFFPRGDALGQTVAFFRAVVLPATIVGIVRDAKHDLRGAPPRMIYQPLAQIPEPPQTPPILTVAVRTSSPLALAGAVRQDVRALTRDVAVTYVRTMDEQIRAALVSERLLATLGISFGGLALLLACIGLYGVMAYDVSRRTRDIGIRLALGARRASVLVSVLRGAATVTAAGLVVGLAAAGFMSAVVSRLLFGVEPRDPATLAIAAGILSATALLAGYLPARRASRVDPIRALRTE
jgi:predicted permease